ncbi:MAG: hypothetical protein C4K58_06975 [Flavobacteriaceae bacterium]|nr:MAG: hypothetical protein C4K58_06975 [Flavobacteriaceae bacterium]
MRAVEFYRDVNVIPPSPAGSIHYVEKDGEVLQFVVDNSGTARQVASAYKLRYVDYILQKTSKEFIETTSSGTVYKITMKDNTELYWLKDPNKINSAIYATYADVSSGNPIVKKVP